MYGSPAVPLAATPTNWVLPAVWSQVFRVRVSRPRLPEGEQTEWMENGSFILYNFRLSIFSYRRRDVSTPTVLLPPSRLPRQHVSVANGRSSQLERYEASPN